MDLSPDLIEAVKGFEGFAPTAQWDYKQHTNGYGTRATSPNETIDQTTAEARLRDELGKAQTFVESVAPNAPPGVKNALTSLTFNSGTNWAGSGLGKAVQAQDYDAARNLFLQYNKAGGQELPGLTARRQQEAAWFGGQPTQTAQAGPPSQGIMAPPLSQGAGLLGNGQPVANNAPVPDTQSAGGLFAQLAQQQQPQMPRPNWMRLPGWNPSLS